MAFTRHTITTSDADQLDGFANDTESRLGAVENSAAVNAQKLMELEQRIEELEANGGGNGGTDPDPDPTINPNLFSEGGDFGGDFWDRVTVDVSGSSSEYTLTATGDFPRIVRFEELAPNTTYTLSSIIRAGSASVHRMNAYTATGMSRQAIFDVSALTVTEVSDGVSANIQQGAGGKVRCSLTFTTDSNVGERQLRIISHAQGRVGGWSGNGSTIHITSAKLEEGSVATGPIE
jgi:hypothetical protein